MISTPQATLSDGQDMSVTARERDATDGSTELRPETSLPRRGVAKVEES